MKGYKALDMEMRAIQGNNMQFQLGKKYTVEGKVVPCENGFHFCENIEDLSFFYNIKNSRIFEVKASGTIKKEKPKYVSKSIQLVRELSKEEVNNYFKQNLKELIKNGDWHVRQAVAKQGYGLDILVGDEDYDVRAVVAEQCYGLDVLVHDENHYVREVVAKQGYGLDILVHDGNWRVRAAVAEQGYGLDILVHDVYWHVREAVARQGYGLDVLICDENCDVRIAVAKQGYGLDILINDEDWYVRSVAQRMLECSISEY